MMTNVVRWGAALTLLLALGCQGPDGPPGPPGPAGSDGEHVPSTNTITGTVTDGTIPLAGVAVTTHPAVATATTNGMGAFSLLPVDVGVYDVSFHLAGFADRTVTVSLPVGAPVKVSVALAREGDGGAGGPTVTVKDQLTAGYAAAVTVPSQVSGNGPFTYAWTQTGGPTATLGGAATGTLGFTTRDFGTSLGPAALASARFDALGIDLDQANGYAFQLVVTDANELSTRATVAVSSTRPTTGLRMVPIGIPVWLSGNGPIFPIGAPPAPQATWTWTLDVSGATGSAATLNGAASQFPSFTPDVVGTYVVAETVAGQTMNVYAGTWQGEMTAASQVDCLLCHTGAIAPDELTPWEKTAHYSALQRKIEGSAGQAFTEACLPCHTVGYDKSAKNNGFDDVEATAGWQFPAQDQPGNWAALEAVPNLGQLAGIQCESCHGPQAGTTAGPHANATNLDISARIKWSAGVCATCHQESPSYDEAAQWAQGAHADLGLAVSEGSVEQSPEAAHCGRCHTAQGYARYVAGLNQGYYAYLTSDGHPLDAGNTVASAADMVGFGMGQATVEAQTCPACHDPHDATYPAQLRIYDATAALPNGMTNVSGMGAGMVCLTCHNSRDGEHTDFATQTTSASGVLIAVPGPTPLTSFGRGPHAAAQGDVVFGFNAYFGARFEPSPHLAVADTCAGCHDAITTGSDPAAKQTTNHSFVVDNTVCASCHTAQMDGAAFEAANELRLDALRSLWASKLRTTLDAAFAAPGATFWARAYDPVNNVYTSVGTGAGQATYNVTLTAANGPILGVSYAPIGTATAGYGPTATAGITLTLSSPIASLTFVNADGSTNSVQTNVTSITVDVQTNGLYLAGSSPAANPTVTPFSAPTAVATDVQVLYKSYWNLLLLNNDNTFGVHNPPFYTSVLANTTAQLVALP